MDKVYNPTNDSGCCGYTTVRTLQTVIVTGLYSTITRSHCLPETSTECPELVQANDGIVQYNKLPISMTLGLHLNAACRAADTSFVGMQGTAAPTSALPLPTMA
jgi:hypothetical protein